MFSWAGYLNGWDLGRFCRSFSCPCSYLAYPLLDVPEEDVLKNITEGKKYHIYVI